MPGTAMLALPTLDEPPARPRPSFRAARWAVLLLFLITLCWQLGPRLFGMNFHTVIPGRVYRGAQPTPRFLDELVKVHGVRTIINLRGCGLPFEWYLKESRKVQELGITLEDICFSALRLPSSLELRRLVEVLDRVEYPVYLHCRRGADRTGLAAVIVLLLQPGIELADAHKHLGLWYGHVSLGKTQVLDQFFALYEEWLAKHGYRHEPANFRRWLLDEYRGGWCSAEMEEFTPLQSATHKGKAMGWRVKVRNTGVRTWSMRANSQVGMHLAYQIWDGAVMLIEGRAGLFDKEVAPGESVEMTLVTPPLGVAGRFRLIAGMAEEDHCWFYQAGSEPHEEELWIRE